MQKTVSRMNKLIEQPATVKSQYDVARMAAFVTWLKHEDAIGNFDQGSFHILRQVLPLL
jgi:hypothetical protein